MGSCRWPYGSSIKVANNFIKRFVKFYVSESCPQKSRGRGCGTGRREQSTLLHVNVQNPFTTKLRELESINSSLTVSEYQFYYHEIILRYEHRAHSMYMCMPSSSDATWNCGSLEHALL